jgi:O-antigen ligase
MIGDHPWTGVGPDQFLYQYGRRYVDPAGWAERYTSHPHNIVLDIWLSLGVPGLVAFTILAIAVGRQVRTAGSSGYFVTGTAVAATGALAAGLAHGMVDNGFFLPDLAVLTWTLMAFVEQHESRRLAAERSHQVNAAGRFLAPGMDP